jgi:hypothetical protein
MNRKQKILTVVGIVAVAMWAIDLNDNLGQVQKYGAGGYLAGLLVIAVAYAGLFFIFKTPKPNT